MNSLPLSDEPHSASSPHFSRAQASWATEVLRACGESPLGSVVVSERDATSCEFQLDQAFLIAGRSAECNIVLTQCEVSSRHLYLQRHGRRVLWFDIASLNGVFQGSKRRHFGEFTSDKPLRIGPFSLRLVPAAVPEGQPPFQVFHGSFNDDELANVHLKVLHGPAKGTIRSLKDPVTLLGRSQLCPLRLKHESIARVHCSLVRTPTGVWAINLQGGDGLYVDGVRVHCARLPDHGELRLGEFQFEVRCFSPERPEGALSTGKCQSLATRPSAVPRVLPPFSLQSGIGNCVSAAPEIQSCNTVPQSMVFDLLREFMAMQQQMFEQSQQTMMMMAQTFGSLLREQTQSLREEMRQVRELTIELQELQRQFATFEASRTSASSKTTSAIAEILPDCVPERQLSRGEGGDARLTDRECFPLPEGSISGEAPSDSETRLSNSENGNAAEPVTSSSRESSPPDQDPHAWLSTRIAEITRERNSRWEGMMNLLMWR